MSFFFFFFLLTHYYYSLWFYPNVRVNVHQKIIQVVHRELWELQDEAESARASL